MEEGGGDTGSSTVSRIRLNNIDSLSKEQILQCWKDQDSYIDALEQKLTQRETKLIQQQQEASRLKNLLVMRLATKEQDILDYVSQINEYKTAQAPGMKDLKSHLLDPAVNMVLTRLKTELEHQKSKLEEAQGELSAWNFTPDSNTGKRLMAKCRMLYSENEELGRMLSSGRLAKLENDLSLQKSFSEEMKKSQTEFEDLVLELDEDVEGMQSTIYQLQQQLREAKQQTGGAPTTNGDVVKRTTDENIGENETTTKKVRTSSPDRTTTTTSPTTMLQHVQNGVVD